MKAIGLFISLILFLFSNGQDNSKINSIDSVVVEIERKINNSDNLVEIRSEQQQQYFIDASRRHLLKVIPTQAPAEGQVVTYYFVDNILIKAELRQVTDTLIDFIEHHYFDKKKQFFEKIEADEDIAIVSWESELFLKNAKKYLLALKTSIK